MNIIIYQDAVDSVLSILVLNERSRAKMWPIFYTQDPENVPSGDTETVIIGWARQGVVNRFSFPAEEPDSRDADLVLGCLSLEEGAGGSGGSAGMNEACVAEIFFNDQEWEK